MERSEQRIRLRTNGIHNNVIVLAEDLAREKT